MSSIRSVGVVVKPHAPRIEDALAQLGAYLEARGVKWVLEEAAAALVAKERREKAGGKGGRRGTSGTGGGSTGRGVPRERVPELADLVVVLGGDGTLLSIAHIAARRGVPVLGVNMGSLGFLTEVPLQEMALTLDALFEGREDLIYPRMLLEARFNGRPESELCLNDVVINKGALARMIHIKIWIDDREVETMRADGLIVATPTGSTAYSLSAGGPILQPPIPALLLTPICPHTLTFRPIVISSESKVRIQLLTSGEEVRLAFDGRRSFLIKKNDVIEIKRAGCELKLVSSPRRSYFELIREKLSWGD
jgi:NAD+ kinase